MTLCVYFAGKVLLTLSTFLLANRQLVSCSSPTPDVTYLALSRPPAVTSLVALCDSAVDHLNKNEAKITVKLQKRAFTVFQTVKMPPLLVRRRPDNVQLCGFYRRQHEGQ